MNRLFLTAITGECCLMYLHGIRPRYNPFTLLRETVERLTGEPLPRNREQCLIYLAHLHLDNCLELHTLLKTIVDVRIEGKSRFITIKKPL